MAVATKSAVPAPDEQHTSPADNTESLNVAGLTDAQAADRLAADGANELVEAKANPVLKFLHYFWGPIPWMIEIAAVLSLVVQHWADFGIIVALLVVNALVGFWEEYHAENTIEALKDKLATNAKVRRGGKWKTIPSRELVRGDRIRVRLGDIVPADAQLLEPATLEIDQAALTGESLPVTRGGGEQIYSGSIVRHGEADALVQATGPRTFFGKTAGLAQQSDTISHFQKAVLKIGDYLIFIAMAMVILILAAALFRGDRIITTVQFALVLTVAAIPVAMPTVLSVTMAVGAKLLAKRQAVVSRLVSIEELAGMDILCSDKTGTLTQNRLKAEDPLILGDASREDVLRAAALASRAEDEDPIDRAILEAAADVDLAGWQVTDFDAFDPVKKRSEAIVRSSDGQTFKVTKGAVQAVLKVASDRDAFADAINEAVDDHASRGFRSLGVAEAAGDGDWRMLGVIPLLDPLREDSAKTIQQARDMGVKVKMVTGDQAPIAREIARRLDLRGDILDAASLEDIPSHQSGQTADAIESAAGFAQVFPEHKYHLVDVLQQRGHILGMTGDGVNDAPALKKADVGIAVSGATDAARSAASIVLLNAGLSVIVDAIRESRKIFQRMNSYAIYRIAETLRVLLFMTVSILAFNFYPVTAVMIVLLALLNDGAILAIAFDRASAGPLPERWQMRRVLGVATVLGVFGVIESFLLFYLARNVYLMPEATIQTMLYLKLSVAGHLTIFVARTPGPFFRSRPSGALLGAVIGTQALATLIAVGGFFMAPLSWQLAGLVWAYCLVGFLFEDVAKLAATRVFDRKRFMVFAHHARTHGAAGAASI